MSEELSNEIPVSEPAAIPEAENDEDSRNVAESKEAQVDENITEEIPQENNADDEKLSNENIDNENIESITKINEETELFGKSPVPEKVAPEVVPEAPQQDNKSSEDQAPVESIAETSTEAQGKKKEAKVVEKLPKIESPKQETENTQEQTNEEPSEKLGELNRRYSDSNNHDGFSSVLGIFLPRPTIKIIPEFAKTLKWLRDPSTKQWISVKQIAALNISNSA